MASWCRVTPTDTDKLLEVLTAAYEETLAKDYPCKVGLDKYHAAGCINAGIVEAVWVEDHTLLVYRINRWAWHSPDMNCLSELLLYKYKKTQGSTFQSVLATLDELAADCGCSVISVGNSLSPQPDRLMLLYERRGYKPHANILIKEL